MLRIWRRDCALCVIGNEFPCRHTIPPPPSYEGSPHCPKDKNLSPFHGEKPLMIKWFLGKKKSKFLKTITNIWVGAWYYTSAYNQYNTLNIIILYKRNYRIPPRITHSGLFLLAFSDNLISEDWFFAEGELFLSFWRCHRPRWGGRRWWCGVADSSLCLKSDMPQR